MKALPILAALAATTLASQAVVIWSGIRNIPIPASEGMGAGFNGVYINIADFTSQNSADDSFAATDVNFFLGGAAIRSSSTFRAARLDATATSPVINLLPGTNLDFSLEFGPGTISASDAHLGMDAGQFNSGDEGYIGFLFSRGGGLLAGWMRVTLTNNGTGTVHEWAYNDEASAPIVVGAIPEPSTGLLSLLALTALLRRRR